MNFQRPANPANRRDDDFRMVVEILHKFHHRLPEREQAQLRDVMRRHDLSQRMPWHR